MTDDARAVPLDEALSAYLDGELDAPGRARVDAALAASPELRARLAALRAVDAGLRALPASGGAPSLAAMRRAVARTPRAAAPRRPPRRRWLALSAALAAGALLAWLVLPTAPRPPGDQARDASPAPAPGPAAPSRGPRALPAGDAGAAGATLAGELGLEREGDLEVVELLDVLDALAEPGEGSG